MIKRGASTCCRHRRHADIARIESGKLTLNVKPMLFADCVPEMAGMFELQGRRRPRAWPSVSSRRHVPEVVRADEKRCGRSSSICGQRDQFTCKGR